MTSFREAFFFKLELLSRFSPGTPGPLCQVPRGLPLIIPFRFRRALLTCLLLFFFRFFLLRLFVWQSRGRFGWNFFFESDKSFNLMAPRFPWYLSRPCLCSLYLIRALCRTFCSGPYRPRFEEVFRVCAPVHRSQKCFFFFPPFPPPPISKRCPLVSLAFVFKLPYFHTPSLDAWRNFFRKTSGSPEEESPSTIPELFSGTCGYLPEACLALPLPRGFFLHPPFPFPFYFD